MSDTAVNFRDQFWRNIRKQGEAMPGVNKKDLDVNMEKLMAEITDDTPRVIKPVQYAQPVHREREARTPLEIIGTAVARLTWMEAEQMGRDIQTRMTDGITLTAAIQAWAAAESKPRTSEA